MLSPTEQKRHNAADLLAAALETTRLGIKTSPSPDHLLPIVDTIADYAIARATDHLTAIASAFIFKHAQLPTDLEESDSSSEPG